MSFELLCIIILTSFTFISSQEVIDKLPLCPTSIQYFPQNLPMHCRMPRSADFPEPSPPQNLSPDRETDPNQMQGLFPPFPGGPIPGGPIPGGPVPGGPIPGGPIPGGPFPGGPIAGGPFPVAMPMMPMPGPSQKLPVIVMPFYSPDPTFSKKQNAVEAGFKPRRPRKPRKKYHRPQRRSEDSNVDSNNDDSDESAEAFVSGSKEGWWKGKSKKKKSRKGYRRSGRRHSSSLRRRRKNSRELLTPVLQYVTKDGYVIFEKQISKNEAKDWLKVNDDNENSEKASREKDTKQNQEKENSKEHHNSREENNKSMENNRSGETDLVIEDTTTGSAHMHKNNHHRHQKPNTSVDTELLEKDNIIGS